MSARKPAHGSPRAKTTTSGRAPAITERQWQQQVLHLARLYRWRVHHCRPAMRASGRYSTPIQGHPGFPDLVLARGDRVIFAELKTDAHSAVLTDEQMAWRDVLLAGGVEWFCWRPKDFLEVRAVLAPLFTVDSQQATSDVPSGGRL